MNGMKVIRFMLDWGGEGRGNGMCVLGGKFPSESFRITFLVILEKILENSFGTPLAEKNIFLTKKFFFPKLAQKDEKIIFSMFGRK